VDGLNSLLEWFVANEAALSGVAATVVILGFVASPLGAGLRGLVRRWALSSSGIVEASVTEAPASDVPPPPEPETDRPSIAVLPFVSSSDDKDSEIFADGMTNDIITALGHVPGFFITSGNSTFVYKAQSVDTRQIGRDLGVRYVVEGRVQRAGSEIRINATLVEARTGEQIWSERFSGDLSDIFALQDQIVQSIVGQLQPELMQAEWRRGGRTPTANLDAWTLLHSARMQFHLGHSRETVEEAIQLATAALEKDPDYAEAHGLLTEAYSYWVMIRWSDDPEGDDERCAYHCRRALELGPNNPIVLFGAALQNAYKGQLETALAQIEQCCAINPNDAFAQSFRGWILASVGRGEEGIDAIDLAFRLSPRDPRTYFLLNMRGYVYLYLGRHSEAGQAYRQSLNLYDGFFWAQIGYVVCLAMQGQMGEAKSALAEVKKGAPEFELRDWEGFLKINTGNPTGERGALIERQVECLRDIWPS